MTKGGRKESQNWCGIVCENKTTNLKKPRNLSGYNSPEKLKLKKAQPNPISLSKERPKLMSLGSFKTSAITFPFLFH